MERKKPKIGDIYELKVQRGLAYVQYTHDGKDNGQLVRVLPEIFSSRPSDYPALSKQKELYFIFCFLERGLRAREIELVSNQAVPEWARPFPVMRKAGGRSRDGRVLKWYIGDGRRLYTVEEMQRALNVRELTPEQRRLSVAQIWPISTLAREIERGWTPESDEKLEVIAQKEREERESYAPAQPADARFIDHYLYFSNKSDAERAAQRLRGRGWAVEVKTGTDNKHWLTLAKQPAPIDDIEETREQLERLADEFGGEYDGWGAAV